MGNHALLSASSSHRWLNCPPSARLCEDYDDKGSDFAAEGTDAHALCEYKLRSALGMEAADPTENLSWYSAEMEDCANGYVSFVMDQVAKSGLSLDLRHEIIKTSAREIADEIVAGPRGNAADLGEVISAGAVHDLIQRSIPAAGIKPQGLFACILTSGVLLTMCAHKVLRVSGRLRFIDSVIHTGYRADRVDLASEFDRFSLSSCRIDDK